MAAGMTGQPDGQETNQSSLPIEPIRYNRAVVTALPGCEGRRDRMAIALDGESLIEDGLADPK